MSVPSFLRRLGARRFNRWCAAGGLIFLIVTVALRLALTPSTAQDLPQYYMAAVMAREGAWESLYPIPGDDPLRNPGFSEGSTLKPRYAAAAQRVGVGPDAVRFILPPPLAPLLMPLAFVSFKTAFYLWTALLVVASWGVAVQAGRVYTLCRESIEKQDHPAAADRANPAHGAVLQDRRAGEDAAGNAEHDSHTPVRWRAYGAGVIVLVVACSPAAHRWVRVLNASPVVGFLLAEAVILMLRGRGVRSGIAVGLGVVIKYAAGVLVPLMLVTRQWRGLAACGVFGAAVLGLSVAVMGAGPFREYLTAIGPTLDRPNEIVENQSIPGLCVRLNDNHPLSPAALRWLNVARLAVLGGVLLLLVRVPRGGQTAPGAVGAFKTPAVLFAGAGALVGWMLLFGPIFWEHYTAYLAPLWGWLAWEVVASASVARRITAGASVALGLVPVTILLRQTLHLTLPTPLGDHMLLGLLGMMAVAVATLWQSRPPATTV